MQADALLELRARAPLLVGGVTAGAGPYGGDARDADRDDAVDATPALSHQAEPPVAKKAAAARKPTVTKKKPTPTKKTATARKKKTG